MIYSVVTIQWYLWGFSIAFTTTSNNPFIGNLSYGALNSLLDFKIGHPNAPTIPVVVYAVWQGVFATVTPALAYFYE